jgi:hypothetical protein
VDAELLTLANTAGTTLVTLLATDAWEKSKSAVGALWRRVHPERAEAVQAELVEARAEVLAARADGDDAVGSELVTEWRRRLRRLLTADPTVAAELRRLLDEELTPALSATGQTWAGNVDMRAEASGNARVYQVGQGTQHITER